VAEVMDRRKKIINFHEGVTHKLLTDAAQKNGAQVFSKIRIADVLNIDHSGLDNDHFGFALKAHFDFVVADGDHVPLFAVEFDGPHHERYERSKLNDKRKNLICEYLDFPLARVRDEHLFQRARGVDYLTWLTELFFSFQMLVEAQKSGQLPWDHPLDPMSFMSNPNIAGRFPLFISADARIRLQQLYKMRVLGSSMPLYFCNTNGNDRDMCIAIVPTTTSSYLVTVASIYLRGFGIAPSEAAEEIATVNLARIAEEYRETNEGMLSSIDLRKTIVNFLRQGGPVGFVADPGFDLGFSLSYKQESGTSRWSVGALGDEPAVEIEEC
jgi:hypothetical protein